MGGGESAACRGPPVLERRWSGRARSSRRARRVAIPRARRAPSASARGRAHGPPDGAGYLRRRHRRHFGGVLV